MNLIDTFSKLSDHAVLAEVTIAAAQERQATARLIGLLAQLDARRLYLGEGVLVVVHVLHPGPASLRACDLRAD